MKGVNDTIEALNKYIVNERERNHINSNAALFLHQERFPSSNFTKAIKTYRYNLWMIDSSKKELILSFEESFRSTTDAEKEDAIDQMNIELILRVIDLIKSSKFDLILRGEFAENDTDK